MSINNSNKPIGYNIRQDIKTQVGSNYGERRQHFTNNHGISEPQVQRSRDFFKPTEENKTVERFSSNATFSTERHILPHRHRAVEAGRAHNKARINDDVRLAFLDRIISGPGENRAPSQLKAPTRPALRLAPTLKSPIKSTIRSTKA